ncbi:hypothetical protein PS15p_212291 [Mucor circinelloides]
MKKNGSGFVATCKRSLHKRKCLLSYAACLTSLTCMRSVCVWYLWVLVFLVINSFTAVLCIWICLMLCLLLHLVCIALIMLSTFYQTKLLPVLLDIGLLCLNCLMLLIALFILWLLLLQIPIQVHFGSLRTLDLIVYECLLGCLACAVSRCKILSKFPSVGFPSESLLFKLLVTCSASLLLQHVYLFCALRISGSHA